ncbi:uncharacterized protein LOC143051768 [Mytilus galloprovincialis]|uniref:uncharacterized protein LOC143051768 n=1 Tax=Mytilus galloprovincialis TaxID=29158 RepID=UPI003F7BAC69
MDPFTKSRDICLWFQQLGILILFTQVFLCQSTCDVELDTLQKRSAPGLKAPKKLWWAKELTPDLHVAGGLIERQIKYAAEAGFKSIISLFNDLRAGDFGGEYLPTAIEASHIAKIAGLQYLAVLEEDEEFASEDAIRKLTEAISQVQKPILLHCNRAFTIAYTTLLYLANQSRHDPNFVPHVDSEKFYKMSALMGKDFTSNETLKAVVAKVTGEPIVENPPKPETEPDDWLDFWLAHPVYRNWYTAGQIRKGHLQELEFIGFKSVINMRLDTTHNGKPSQETVTLLNVLDGTPTYDKDYKPLRQTHSHIKNIILDASKQNHYISPTSPVNYEHRHYEEYGDEIGYNEDLQSEHIKEFDLDYYLLPIESTGKYSKELFAKYKDKLLEIGKQGPVLVHCASGKRVAFMAVLAAALQHEKDFKWALKRINELGFEVSRTKNRDVYEMYSAWLNPDHGNKTEL